MSSQKIGTNIADIICAHANRAGDNPALVIKDRQVSYDALVRAASALAFSFSAYGFGSGSRVAIRLRRPEQVIFTLIGLWMIDALPLVLDFQTNNEEKSKLAKQFDLSAFVVDSGADDRICPSILYPSLPAEVTAERNAYPYQVSASSSPAAIQLTSGTTGRPQGLILSHEAIIFRQLMRPDYSLSSIPRPFLSCHSLAMSAQRLRVVGQLIAGGAVVLFPPIFGTPELVEAINSHDVGSVFVASTIAREMLGLCEHGKGPLLSGLDGFAVGGSALSAEEKIALQARVSPAFYDSYSSSLTGNISILRGRDVIERPETVGRVTPLVRLEIVDPTGKPVPLGAEGLLRVRSPGMASEILSYGFDDKRDKIVDGWAYPGDIGILSSEGFLSITGRSSEVIIRGGINVHPAEVEGVLLEIPGVLDCAVVGFAQKREGQEIAAFIVTSKNMDERDLKRHCREKLLPYKVPRRFISIDTLPRNAAGKVVKSKLIEKLQMGEPDNGDVT